MLFNPHVTIVGWIKLLFLLVDDESTPRNQAIGRAIIGRNDKSCGTQKGLCLQGQCIYQQGRESIQKYCHTVDVKF